MLQRSTYEATLETSLRAAWRLDDVISSDAQLDFSRNFLPESLARTAELSTLTPDEQRLLNQISAHEYLRMFVIVEEFILPALFDHSRTLVGRDPVGIRAMINFAGEEAKHMHMFERFESAFNRQFPVECKMIGPSDALVAEVLRHHPLAVALTILMFEWMTQVHYLGSIRDAGDLEPLFKSMLKHHWVEESQHAKLDTLLVDSLAEGLDKQAIDGAIRECLEIVDYFDGGLKAQAGLNLDALERALGRSLDDRAATEAQQHQAARWTYLGSGMTHPTFVATLEELSPEGAARVAETARAFH
jgi:hypothetical protein